MSRSLVAVLLVGIAMTQEVSQADDPAGASPEPLIAPASEEAAQQCQESWAKYVGSEVTIENSVGMVFNFIPPGEFTMGLPESWVATNGGLMPYDDDSREHRVRLTQPFYVSVCETTQLQWQEVMGTNPSGYSAYGTEADPVRGANTTNFPVENVTWYDCIEFCNRLSRLEGLDEYYLVRGGEVTILGGNGYRLLTEAEWEHACRAGTTTDFSFGPMCNGLQANIDGNRPHGTPEWGPTIGNPIPVGIYAPNALGLYDMHGNVWEWCWDSYEPYGDEFGVLIDPVCSESGSRRIARGGHCLCPARTATSTNRGSFAPDDATPHHGFRVARTP